MTLVKTMRRWHLQRLYITYFSTESEALHTVEKVQHGMFISVNII